MQYFLNTFYTKTELSHSLLSDMKLLKKMFPKMLGMKNVNRVHKFFFQVSAKYRMTHSNIPIAVKHRRDNYK